MKATVYMTATASLSIEVEIPDGLDPDEAKEQAIEKAYDNLPRGICAQCGGWREKWGREIGEWELVDDAPVELFA
jgi:hypothetical protein